MLPTSPRDGKLPTRAGIGFKTGHFDDVLAAATPPAFIEIHAENYMGEGGRPHAQLATLCARIALSVHGVGLSLGGFDAPDPRHLSRLATLLTRYDPESFSEHLAWSTHGGQFFNDLLPLRYDDATLLRTCAHIAQVQDTLGRRLLLENPSRYLEWIGGATAEPQFITEIVRRTGCGLLLDINNVHVSCHNLGGDTRAYLDALPLHAVGEIHLAGHARDGALLIDTHGAPVDYSVWSLYGDVIARIGPQPTLIEWDTAPPAFAVLMREALQAEAIMNAATARIAA
ncbi:MAG: DUF692 domain-containing protein [Luteimonas sp.]